jgi:hypothetical protein
MIPPGWGSGGMKGGACTQPGADRNTIEDIRVVPLDGFCGPYARFLFAVRILRAACASLAWLAISTGRERCCCIIGARGRTTVSQLCGSIVPDSWKPGALLRKGPVLSILAFCFEGATF